MPARKFAPDERTLGCAFRKHPSSQYDRLARVLRAREFDRARPQLRVRAFGKKAAHHFIRDDLRARCHHLGEGLQKKFTVRRHAIRRIQPRAQPRKAPALQCHPDERLAVRGIVRLLRCILFRDGEHGIAGTGEIQRPHHLRRRTRRRQHPLSVPLFQHRAARASRHLCEPAQRTEPELRVFFPAAERLC